MKRHPILEKKLFRYTILFLLLKLIKKLVGEKIIRYVMNRNVKLLILFGAAALRSLMLDLGLLKIIWGEIFSYF